LYFQNFADLNYYAGFEVSKPLFDSVYLADLKSFDFVADFVY